MDAFIAVEIQARIHAVTNHNPLLATVRDAIGSQFDTAIGQLERSLGACPDALWRVRLWELPPVDERPPWISDVFSEFWYLAYHTLFWLDLYLTCKPEPEFAPPKPFAWTEDIPAVIPDRPYTREELTAYLTSLRGKAHDTLSTLTEERACEPIGFYGWSEGRDISFFDVQLHNLRHVQEHAAQLSLFLGQHGIPSSQGDG